MTRRASIEIDLAIGVPPEHWTAAWVQNRLLEAYSIERKMPGARRFAASGTWPAVRHDFADVVGWTDARDRVLDTWERTHGGVSPKEVARLEQAHEWLRIHLARYETERFCLSAWAAAIAYQKSLSRLLMQKRWSRTTFYRRVAAGAHIIALTLNSKGEPVS